MEGAGPKKLHTLDSKEDDRISLLPEEILHRILCYLSQEEAIQTCVLSKTWRYLGYTRPQIDFTFIERRGPLDSALDPILQACHYRNLRLDEFAVHLSSDNNLTLLMHKWIPVIIHNMCVKRFQLTNFRPQLFQLPSLIIESHHIRTLYLRSCMLNSLTAQVRVDLKSLKTLSLDNVYIPEEILDNILSNCPFLENVSLNECNGFTRIKPLVNNNNNNNNNNNKPTKLESFYFKGNGTHREVSIEIGDDYLQTLTRVELEWCLLSVSHNKPLGFAHHRRLCLTKMDMLSDSFPCHFTTLYLCDVYIPEEILDSILSDCPFLEDVYLHDCRGFKRITMFSKKPTNLTLFSFYGGHDPYGPCVSIEIGDGIQTLRTIQIGGCLFSVSHNKPLESARLTRLSLTRVKLLLESFSCNLHSLEELELNQCSGIVEFKLSSRSMKRLDIHNISKPFRVTVDAPCIVNFNYEGILPQSISFATTSNEWKSKINLGYNYHEPSFQELYGLLKAIRQSEISLELDQIKIDRFWRQLGIGSTNDDIVGGVSEEAKHELPVAVEHLRIQRSYYEHVHSSADLFLNMLFHLFRPSFVYMGTDMLKDSSNQHREIAELLLKEREMAQICIWQCGLEGARLQVLYRYQRDWQPIEYTSFTDVCKKGADRELELRIQLKWRVTF